MPPSSARTVVVDPVLSLPLNGFLRLDVAPSEAAASLSVVYRAPFPLAAAEATEATRSGSSQSALAS